MFLFFARKFTFTHFIVTIFRQKKYNYQGARQKSGDLWRRIFGYAKELSLLSIWKLSLARTWRKLLQHVSKPLPIPKDVLLTTNWLSCTS